jgi:hypothetical protein
MVGGLPIHGGWCLRWSPRWKRWQKPTTRTITLIILVVLVPPLGPTVKERAPRQFALVRPVAQSAREEQPALAEAAHGAGRRARPSERLEKGAHRDLDLERRGLVPLYRWSRSQARRAASSRVRAACLGALPAEPNARMSTSGMNSSAISRR